MSTEIVEKTPEFGEVTQKLDKWGSLTSILENATDEVIEALKKDLKKKEICINGYTNALVPSSGKRTIEDNVIFDEFLKKIGFIDDDIYQERICVVSGCAFQPTSLGTNFNHLIGYHKVPIKGIARLVSIIKGDTRKPKTGLDGIKNNFQTSHMGTD